MGESKITVNVTVALTIRVSEGQSVDEVLDEMEYNFKASEDHEADIEGMEIVDYELVDVC